jgi:hypothetical protein
MVEVEQQDLITKATIAAERLQHETERYEAVLQKMQAFEARQILGGKSSAGEPMKREPTEAERIVEENKSAFKGTVLEGVYK